MIGVQKTNKEKVPGTILREPDDFLGKRRDGHPLG